MSSWLLHLGEHGDSLAEHKKAAEDAYYGRRQGQHSLHQNRRQLQHQLLHLSLCQVHQDEEEEIAKKKAYLAQQLGNWWSLIQVSDTDKGKVFTLSAWRPQPFDLD